jgi:hypothetical protein
METPLLDPVLPVEGRHVLHLFFRVDYAAWDLLDGAQRIAAKTALASLVQEIRATPATQLLTFSIVSPKSDLGFMLLTPGLHTADAFAKQLGLAIGPGILTPEFSWLSMTERSEYTPGENEYAQTLEKEDSSFPVRQSSRKRWRLFASAWQSISTTGSRRISRTAPSFASIQCPSAALVRGKTGMR